MTEIPVLSLMVFVPIGAAVPLALVDRRYEPFIKAACTFVTMVVLTLAIGAYVVYRPPADSAFTLIEDRPWIEPFGIHLKFGLDGLSLSMALITALLSVVAMLCSWSSIHTRVKEFYLLLLVLETGMMGVFLALDLFLFYVFWELTLIPMTLIIGIWGGPRRIYSAVKFFIYTAAGSLFMLVALIYVALQARTFDMIDIAHRLPGLGLDGATQALLFFAFAFAFAIKVPVFPLHTWLPDAHVEAPTAGSVILAGVLLKMGGYGFMRIAVPWFPDSAREYAPLFLALGVIGIIYGAFMAMTQGDIKRLIAYSSVSHLGFVMLAIFSFHETAAQGAILEMVNHGLSTGALFALVGVIYDKTHRRGVDDFGGLAATMPRYATVFLVATLASIGLPGLNGFVGELLILLGSFRTQPYFAAAAVLGVVLGAVYMLRLYRNMFFGQIRTRLVGEVKDIGGQELSYLMPLTLGMVLLGVLPNTILVKTARTVSDLLSRLV